MLDFNFDKMLFTIGPENHSADRIKTILNEHPEVQFVSLVGIDIGGHGTDEKIPVRAFVLVFLVAMIGSSFFTWGRS